MISTLSVMSRRQPFSAFGATSFEHEASVFARHASAEAMCLCASSIVRLKGALRHRNEFSLKTKTPRLAAAWVYVKESARRVVVQFERTPSAFSLRSQRISAFSAFELAL